MKPLSHFSAACQTLTRGGFVERYPGPFLVHSSRTGGELKPTGGGRTIDSVVVEGGGDDADVDVVTVFTTGQFAPKGPAITVGSDVGCSLRVAAASVSRVHARLQRAADGWRIEDAGSLVGTWVNGEAVETMVARKLEPGDRISLGALDLTFLPTSFFYDFVQKAAG